MSTAYILGAGFSKAINENMPLCDELGKSIFENLKNKSDYLDFGAPLEGINFEQHFSHLAIREPYESEGNYLKKLSNFYIVKNEIAREIFKSQETSVNGNISLDKLFIDIQKNLNNVIITFNYDTLFEKLYKEYFNKANPNKNFELVPYISDKAGLDVYSVQQNNDNPILYKLHGSINWLKIPDDKLGVSCLGFSSENDDLFEKLYKENINELNLNGYEPYIIPPMIVKNEFYDNPFTRSIWNNACNSLKKVDNVVVIGYSFPQSDIASVNMMLYSFQQNEQEKVRISVVDKRMNDNNETPEAFRKRTIQSFQNLFKGNTKIQVDDEPIDGLENYIERLE